MTTLTTKLVKDGNSVAVRLPKTALILSGLQSSTVINMDIQHGKVTLRPAESPRQKWVAKIEQIQKSQAAAQLADEELQDWGATLSDGLD